MAEASIEELMAPTVLRSVKPRKRLTAVRVANVPREQLILRRKHLTFVRYDGPMSWAEAYTEFKGWQTAIGSAFGFVALILGALFNFHLNRRRDAALRKDEVHSIAIALYSEILLLREKVTALARIVAAWHQDRGIYQQFLADHRPRAPILYPKLADKLGRLLLAVTRFQADYRAARDGLALMVDKGRGFDYNVLRVLSPAENAVTAIRPPLREIEVMGGIKSPAADPDFGDAKDVSDFENEPRQGN